MTAVGGFFRHSPPSVSVSPWTGPSNDVSAPRHVVDEQGPGEVPWRVLAAIEVALRPDPSTGTVDAAGLGRLLAEAGPGQLTDPAADLLDSWTTAVAAWWPTSAPEPAEWRPLARVVAAVLDGERLSDALVHHAAAASPAEAA